MYTNLMKGDAGMLNETQKKFFHVSKILLAILCALFIVALFLQFVCMLWVCLLPDKLADFFENFRIWKPFVSDMYSFKQATAELCGSMIAYAFAIYFTKSSCDIFASLEKGESLPLEKVRKISVAAIISAVLVPLVRNIAMETFVNGDFVKDSFDVGLFAFGAVLFAFSYSFIKGKDKEV